MSIRYQVLGAPGRDNALYVRVESGQRITRLLFDCGDGCLGALPRAEIQAIEHLCFSHLHIDHIAGFDGLLRSTFNRPAPPMQVWGPPDTLRLLHHRLRSILWDRVADQPGVWQIHDVLPDRIIGARLITGEAFAIAHPLAPRPFSGQLIATPDFTVDALHLDHGTPSLGYIIRETPRRTIDAAALARLGLPPGPWLRELKADPDASMPITIAGQRFERAMLREALLTTTPGEALAYLTDFALDADWIARLAEWLRGCTTLVCEAQYRQADWRLAQRYYHTTAPQVAELARRAGVGRLILIHLSDRYTAAAWQALLQEARAIFPQTDVPAHWSIPGVAAPDADAP